MSIFRKAMGLFVVLDEEQKASAPEVVSYEAQQQTTAPAETQQVAVTQQEVAKFEQHFANLFDKANLPGPDYYEFWKMMDALEVHIAEPTARVVAVFESLKIQGLTKENLFGSAAKYIEIIKEDRNNFETAARNKADSEIAGRQSQIKQILVSREQKAAQLAQLQKEIDEASNQATRLQQEINDEQTKIASAQTGYLAACQAMLSKIEQDIALFKQKLG